MVALLAEQVTVFRAALVVEAHFHRKLVGQEHLDRAMLVDQLLRGLVQVAVVLVPQVQQVLRDRLMVA